LVAAKKSVVEAASAASGAETQEEVTA
jgi:hypothetical protein